MKKFLILLFIATTFSVAGYSQTYHYDVNGDGVVTAADVTALYDYMLGNVPSGDEPSGDEHEYVDLGLPSGTLWATMNVGANSPEEYGDYFAWGETAPKDVYDWSTYKWCNGSERTLTKYCTSSSYGTVDNKTELDHEDDAATANWGPEWRMPSLEQLQELYNNCTTEWTTRNGVAGRLFTSAINGASLFLPAAGNRLNSGLDNAGSNGYYWSRTLYASYPNYAYNLNFSSRYVYWGDWYRRNYGLCVRAVRVVQNAVCGVAMEVQAKVYNYDVNGDGFVTAADVTALYDYMLGNVPSGDEHEYVDLGLPSGTLWATMNVGASSPEESGDYFAWGETTTKDFYDWSTYKWCNGDYNKLTKYCTNSSYGYNGFVDNKTELDPEDDAATANWGPEWRMPTKEQQDELRNYCTSEWTTRNGVAGRLFTSTINGASLFLPAAGYRWNGGLYDAGLYGNVWSRALSASGPYYAFYLYFNSGSVYSGSSSRGRGQSVRAVRVVQN